MSTHGLQVFDKTIQTTNVWLEEIGRDMGADRQAAYHALSAVLRAMRDRVPVELAAHFGAQLPMLIRGMYYEQWRPSEQPHKERSLDDFLGEVRGNLGPMKPVDVEAATRAVLAALARHVTEGQIAKVRDAMPGAVRALWDGIEPR